MMHSNLYKDIRIYKDNDLQNFLFSLEDRYYIIDEVQRYGKLVNFADNAKNPYHQWFRYREGFAGRLVEDILQRSNAVKGEFVVDPFCGSGTTPLAAVMSGYCGIGVDINPMAAFLTNVKLKPYTWDQLKDVENKAYSIDLDSLSYDEKLFLEVERFFDQRRLIDLLKIKSFIDNSGSEIVRDICSTAYLSIIEDCSERKRDGNGLKTRPSTVKSVKLKFLSKLQEIIEDIRYIRPIDGSIGYGIAGDARSLNSIIGPILKDHKSKVSSIIFSPPYPNSFDYCESYKMELVLGGFVKDISGLNALRSRAVRSFVGSKTLVKSNKYIDMIAKEIELEIPQKEQATNRIDSRTRKVPNMIKGYFDDMSLIIDQCAIALPKGKKCYIVVDQSSYLGKLVPTDLLLAYLSEDVGFKVNQIIICRKAKTSGQQLQKYPYLADALRESIIELEKA